MSKNALLACGIVAGPLFVGSALIQGSTREGFDLGYHPISLLSLGDFGWLQIATFVLTGVLFLACAAGLRRSLHGSRAGTWGPLLVGVAGAALIVAGVFLTDAGAGFPPGAPAGAPHMTWHGALHELGAITSFVVMLALCLVFARRFASDGERGWLAIAVACAAAPVVLLAWPSLDGFSVRLLAASAIQLAFVGALAWKWRVRAGSSYPSTGSSSAALMDHAHRSA